MLALSVVELSEVSALSLSASCVCISGARWRVAGLICIGRVVGGVAPQLAVQHLGKGLRQLIAPLTPDLAGSLWRAEARTIGKAERQTDDEGDRTERTIRETPARLFSRSVRHPFRIRCIMSAALLSQLNVCRVVFEAV